MIKYKITLTAGRKTKTFYYTKKPIKADRIAAIAAFGKDLNVSVEVSKVNLKKVS